MYNNDNEFKIPIYNENGITVSSTNELSRLYSLNSNKEGVLIKFGGDVFCIKKSIVNILEENSANNIIFIKLENNIWIDITQNLELEDMYVIEIFSKKNENLFAISYIDYYNQAILLGNDTFKQNTEEDKIIKLKIIKKIDNSWSKNNLNFPMSEFRDTWNNPTLQPPTIINNFLDVSFKNDYLIFNTLYYTLLVQFIETHIYKFDNNSNNYIREHKFLAFKGKYSLNTAIYPFKIIDNNYNILYIFHDLISTRTFLKKQINRILTWKDVNIDIKNGEIYYFKYDQSNLFSSNVGLKFNSDDTNSYISSNYGYSFKNIITVPISTDNPTHNLKVNTDMLIEGILETQTNVNIGGDLTVTGNINTTNKFLPLNSIILWDSTDQNIPDSFVKLNDNNTIQLGGSTYFIIKYESTS